MKTSLSYFLLTLLPVVAAPHPDWSVSIVSDDLAIGSFHSLAVDSTGNPAASFVDITARQVKLARLANGTWAVETVDPGNGSTQIGNYNSLRFAPDGNPAVAYRAASGDLMRYAKFNGTSWAVTPIPDTTTSSSWSSLAFAPDGNPAIAFKSGSSQLAYAFFNGSNWSVTPDVDSFSVTGDNASLAFGSDGKPAIACFRPTSTQLRFVRFGASTWGNPTSPATLTSTSTADPSLAFSPSGNPAMAYRDLGAGKLRYAEMIAGSWFFEDVDDMAVAGLIESCELAFNPVTGEPSIAYTDPDGKDLKFAVKTDAGWQITTVDPDGDTGRYPKLAFSPTGQPFITYLLSNGGSDNDLMMATVPPVPVTFSSFGENTGFAYAPNAGWIHFRHDQPAAPAGVIVGESFLSGEAWAPNFGWVYFGSGSPENGSSYSNDSPNNYGVNRTSDGALQGRAWAPNIGWIHFDATKGTPRMNLLSGALEGYAWAPNIGWINLATGLLTVESLDTRDLDNDGISDDWEKIHFTSLTQANATSDSDGDGVRDSDEYIAGTDPGDKGSWLRITGQSLAGDLMSTTLEFSSSASRIYRIHTSTGLDDWGDDTQHGFFQGDEPTTTRTITHLAETKLFFRVSARPPLFPEP